MVANAPRQRAPTYWSKATKLLIAPVTNTVVCLCKWFYYDTSTVLTSRWKIMLMRICHFPRLMCVFLVANHFDLFPLFYELIILFKTKFMSKKILYIWMNKKLNLFWKRIFAFYFRRDEGGVSIQLKLRISFDANWHCFAQIRLTWRHCSELLDKSSGSRWPSQRNSDADQTQAESHRVKLRRIHNASHFTYCSRQIEINIVTIDLLSSDSPLSVASYVLRTMCKDHNLNINTNKYWESEKQKINWQFQWNRRSH